MAIGTIFAPNLDAAGAHLAAWKLAMMISKNHYVNFTCEWFETPKYLNDSWQITVSVGTDPIGIKKNAEGTLLSPCTISMYFAKPIQRIEVYEGEWADELPEESVRYDKAILFHCEGGRRFCISCMLNGPGIATFLHFSEDDLVINQMLEETKSRLILE